MLGQMIRVIAYIDDMLGLKRPIPRTLSNTFRAGVTVNFAILLFEVLWQFIPGGWDLISAVLRHVGLRKARIDCGDLYACARARQEGGARGELVEATERPQRRMHVGGDSV